MATFNPTQPCNQPAPLADVKFRVSKSARRVNNVLAAKRRIKAASKAIALCARTPGCDATYHIMLATALRITYCLGA